VAVALAVVTAVAARRLVAAPVLSALAPGVLAAVASWCTGALVLALACGHGAHVLIPASAAALAIPVALLLTSARGVTDRVLAHRWLPWLAGALCAGWYFTVSYTRHAHFGSGSRDMGLFLQSVWLLSRFTSPENTVMGMNAFADHMELVDVLVAPLMWVWADAGALLLVQAVAAGLGAVPVWRMAASRLGSPASGALAAAAYFLSYEIANGVQFDWNPTTVSLGLFPWAVEAALSGRWRRMALFLVAVGLCKENLLLYVGGLGLMLAVTGAPRRVVVATVVLPAMAFAVEMKLLFPLFREGGFRHFYFTDLGTDFLDVALNLLRTPARALSVLFTPGQKVDGLLLPFTSTAFLGLLAPSSLLPMLPGILERFGSTFSNSWWGHHYGGPTHALAVCGAILGGARLRARLVARPALAAPAAEPLRHAAGLWPAVTLLLATVLVDGGPWGATDLFVLRKPYHPSVGDRATMRAAVDSVPPAVSVAAQNYLVAHLATRPRIYMLEHARRADYVAMTPTTNPWPHDRGYHDRLAQDLLREGWRVHFCRGNSFVLSRTPGESVPCPVLGR
jgi:uncharacterized membrane protein